MAPSIRLNRAQKFIFISFVAEYIDTLLIDMACDISFWCDIFQLSQQNRYDEGSIQTESATLVAGNIGITFGEGRQYLFQGLASPPQVLV